MRRALTALLISMASASAWGVTVTLAPSEALSCMTPQRAERGTPRYPKEALDRKEGGTVSAEMTFADAAKAPDVKLHGVDNKALREAVAEHLKTFRVPCLGSAQQAVIAVDFHFDPVDGRQVLWTNARDRHTGQAARARECLIWTLGMPDYPPRALQNDEQGVVALDLRFADAVSGPQVIVLDETPGRWLIQAARTAAQGTRLPCYEGGAPFTYRVYFQFKIAGGNRAVLKDVPLLTYLGAVKDIKSAQAYFNFNEMKCPFDVRVEVRQPLDDNLVGELAESVPERAFFLAWLSRQRLELEPRLQNRLLGERLTVDVPCGALRLGTPSGGGASQ